MPDVLPPPPAGGAAPNADNMFADFTDVLDQNFEYDYEPLGNLLVVEMHNPPKITKGGIYMPDNAVPRPNLATVLHIGTGQRSGLNGTLIPTICQVKDTILVQPFGVTTIKFHGDQEVAFISENDVLARIFRKDKPVEETPQ